MAPQSPQRVVSAVGGGGEGEDEEMAVVVVMVVVDEVRGGR